MSHGWEVFVYALAVQLPDDLYIGHFDKPHTANVF